MAFGAPTTVPGVKPANPVTGGFVGTPRPVTPAGPAANGGRPWTPQQLNFFRAMSARANQNQVHPVGLPSSQEIPFEQNFNSINQGANQTLAQNAYQGQLAAQGFAPQFANEQNVYDQNRAAEPGQFVGRGILGSGIDHSALQNLDYSHLQNVASLANQRQQSLGGFQLAAQQIENQRTQALAQLRLQHQQALSSYAGSTIPRIK